MSGEETKPPHEWKLPTEETFRVSTMVYDTQTKTTTYHHNVGTFTVPIEPAAFIPPDPTLHLPMVDCDCDACFQYWCHDPDPHPPMRDCGCLLQCKPYFDAKDGSPSDGAMYAAIPSTPWTVSNARYALAMVLHGTTEQQEEARKFFLYHLSRNRKR